MINDKINVDDLVSSIESQRRLLATKLAEENSNDNKILLSIVNKYLKIIQTDFLTERIALMIAKNQSNVTLICDLLTPDERFFDREKIITNPLSNLKCYTLIDKNKYLDVDWDRSILSILLDKLPVDYRLYYHYNYLESSSYKINYEITIYRGNMFLNDPWVRALCCWETCSRHDERNTEYFDTEIVQ